MFFLNFDVLIFVVLTFPLKYDVFISSYDDRNFFFRVDLESGIRNDFLKPEDINPDGYMLKVTNSLDSKVRSQKKLLS